MKLAFALNIFTSRLLTVVLIKNKKIIFLCLMRDLNAGNVKDAARSWRRPVRREFAKIKPSKLSSSATTSPLPLAHLFSASLLLLTYSIMIHYFNRPPPFDEHMTPLSIEETWAGDSLTLVYLDTSSLTGLQRIRNFVTAVFYNAILLSSDSWRRL